MAQNRIDAITRAVAEDDIGPALTRRLFSGGAAALFAALGLRAVGIEEAEAQSSCRQRCRNKKTREKRRRCRRRCRRQEQECQPADNTQGSCPLGQICTPRGICETGCSGTGRGSCPTGQLCVNGQCEADPRCIPFCR